MTQDSFLGRKLTDHQTAQVLEELIDGPGREGQKHPKSVPGP